MYRMYENHKFYAIVEEPAYLVKGRKYPLVTDDVCGVYKGGWLNDQVPTCLFEIINM